MRRNCVYKYIVKNQPKKDLVIYQYGNKTEYLIHHEGKSCYSTHELNGGKVKDSATLDKIWTDSNILSIYEDSIIHIQVNWNK